MDREAFYTSILTLKLGSKSQQVVVKDVQRHPVRPIIMHLDFQRVREDVEITLTVRIHFLNEAQARASRTKARVNHLLTDVEVRCLPRYCPSTSKSTSRISSSTRSITCPTSSCRKACRS